MIKNLLKMNYSVFVSWLFSYIILLFVPILISTVVYYEAEQIIKTEINRYNMAMLKQCQQDIDNGLQDINNLTKQIVMNGKLQQLMHVSGTIAGNNAIVAYDLSKNLNYLKVGSGFITDFYIYLHNTGQILSTSGLYDKDIYFTSKIKKSNYNIQISYEQWYKVIQGKYPGEYLPMDGERTTQNVFDNTVVYSQNLPIISSTQPEATLVVVLNYKRFQNAMQNIQPVNNGWGLTLDKDNHILFSNKPIDQDWSIKYEDLTKDSDLIFSKFNGEAAAISYISSKNSKWKYISVIPSQVFSQKALYVKRLATSSLLICLLLGGIAAYFFTKRNYNPVSKMIKLLERKSGVILGRGLNEYRIIQDAINNTISENEKINEVLRRQKNVLCSNFLMRMIKGKVTDSDTIFNSLESYQIKFDSDSFAIMLFYIVDFDKFFDNDKSKTPEDKLQMVQFIITNVVEELAQRKNYGYITEIDEMLACIINFKQEDNRDRKQILLEIANEAQQFISEKFHIDFLITISSIHETVFGIPEAYQEALSVMEYRTTTENAQLVFYEDMNTSENCYTYSIEMEHKLINCIKAGDLKTAMDIINYVFEVNFSKTSLSSDMNKCLMFDLVSTMLKTTSEMSSSNDRSFIEELNIVKRLLGSEKMLDMKKQMIEILKEICMHTQQNKKGKKENFIDDVMVFIEDHYHDSNLSVTVIAERFNLTPQYLTKIFKDQKGEGLYDYMTKLRLEKAKLMLKEAEASIKDVAIKVGYYNCNVFIRAFKKYEGITPGMYKDME